MKEQLLQILQEVAKGIKSPEVAQNEILSLGNNTSNSYSVPIWLKEDDFRVAKILYKENRLKGIYYLSKIARPYITDHYLNWCDNFLRKHTIN